MPSTSTPAKLTEELARVDGALVCEDEPLAKHTSFGIGGPADVLVTPADVGAMQELMRITAEAGVQPVILGNGSNVIVRDEGVRGVVIRIAGTLGHIATDGTLAIVEAGATLAAVCFYCAQKGLSGLEFAAGIPGTLGGALIMNAGANGGEMGDVTEWVEVVRPHGTITRIDGSAVDFQYRRSSLREADGTIVRAGLRLEPGDPTEIHQELCDTIALRCAKQPVSLPSAGSVFKRPEEDFAGRLLEEAGAKGMRIGNAAVSDKHANFVVNLGGATADDVLELIEAARELVHDKFGVLLQLEVCVLGERPE